MSLQNQKSSRGKLSWLEKKMHSSRSRILRRIFHFLHFYVRPLMLALSALFLAAAFYMLTVNFRLVRSSPKGLQPVIRISVLDWLQARALGRSAKASEAKNDFAAAKMSWQLATANDHGNPKWLRGWLANIMHEKPSWKLRRDSLVYISHLQWLSQTNRPINRADFALIANALEHCRLYPDVWDLFEFEKDFVSPEEKAPLLRTLFHLGDHKRFRDLWSEIQLQTPGWLEDPLMQLYHLGNQAILENDPSSLDALNQAVAALSPSSPRYAKAQQIALRATLAAGDVPASRKILEDLRQRQEATLPDTLRFWQLLIAKEAPKEIAQDLENSGDPVSEQEVLLLLQMLTDAGLAEETSKTAEKMIEQIGADSPGLWFTYGDWLIRQEKWTLLRDLARQSAGISEIETIAFYWQGLIDRERERHDQAQERFLRIADFMTSTPQFDPIRFELARRLMALDQHAIGDKLMKEMDGETNESRAYWKLRMDSAPDLKAFSQAAKAAYDSDPEFDRHIYNHLDALLQEQKEPELTLSLSDKLIQRHPDFIPFQLFRARSLKLNEKHEEADALTKKINDTRAERIQQVEEAFSQRDWKAFSQASQAAYDSDPEFEPHIYNYLVGLLQERREPPLALFLSSRLIQRQPDLPHFHLIHSHALLLNEKYEEAEAVLKNISMTEEAAETPMANDYNMALFKLAAGKGESEEVLRLYKTLNLENYMPETSQWVEETIAKISQSEKEGGGDRNWKQRVGEVGVHGGGS